MQKIQHELKDKALFNKIAQDYFNKDIYVVSSEARKFQLNSLIKLYFEKTSKKELGTILELGCGVGASAQYLVGKYEKYIGVDYTEKFIELAQTNFSDKNNKFICANIKDFTVNSNEDIDFVFGVGVLHHIDNLEKVFENLKTIGNKETVFGFIEPQSSNPLIQLMRKIRMLIDKGYSSDQVFFKKQFIDDVFRKNGFKIIAIKYQGYFTPPFAQIMVKPAFIFKKIIRLLIATDNIIQNNLNNPLSWNIIWIAKKV